MISPGALNVVRPAANKVPDPSAAVFQPPKVYPVRAKPEAESNVVSNVPTVRESATVFAALVFPLPL